MKADKLLEALLAIRTMARARARRIHMPNRDGIPLELFIDSVLHEYRVEQGEKKR